MNTLRGTGRVRCHLYWAAAVGPALLLAAAATLPAVWWEPLHIDEAITLEFAPESVPAIIRDIFVERGGAPVFFLVEHVSLEWPGGLAGLRLPPVLFFLVAVGLSAPVARELCGRNAGLLLPPLLALAPLAVRLSTFGRMYTLFLAGVLLAVWLLLRATARGERNAWIAAGAVAGGLVYVHPIAPLYIGVALATAYLYSHAPLRPFLRSARPGLVTLGLVASPYVYALAVLSRRYDVGSPESSIFESGSGRPVPAESLLALASGEWLGTALLGALSLTGLITILRRDQRIGVALALWVVVPVAFFSLVPSETVFFPRYLLPSLPFFLLVVAVGCLTAGRLIRRPLLGAAALVAAILVWEAVETASRLERLRDLQLPQAVDVVAGAGDAVLFSSIGAPVGGRPGELLDSYAALELPEIGRVEELPGVDPRYTPDVQTRGAAVVRNFLEDRSSKRQGMWLFSGSPRRLDLASRRLEAEPGIEVRRISPSILLVHSSEPLDPRSLVEQGVVVRSAWLGPTGRARWSRSLIDIDREALGGTR
jgi:hypothetical protein